MTVDAPLRLFETDVLPEWIDYNGHLNVAYYARAFDLATDAFFDLVGVGEAYVRGNKHSVFMVESHFCYLDEITLGDRLAFATRLLDCDAKRIHLFHEMFHAGKGFKAATSEWLGVHVAMEAGGAAPFPEPVRTRLEEIAASHRALPPPDEAGSVIAIRHHDG